MLVRVYEYSDGVLPRALPNLNISPTLASLEDVYLESFNARRALGHTSLLTDISAYDVVMGVMAFTTRSFRFMIQPESKNV